MPLRDHFRPPLDDESSWEGFHGGWPMMIVADLMKRLLYAELLALMGQTDAALESEPPTVYAVACRTTRRDRRWLAEAWFHPLRLGQLLPTLPLWLADNLAVPLDLEASYEETCRILRLPGVREF